MLSSKWKSVSLRSKLDATSRACLPDVQLPRGVQSVVSVQIRRRLGKPIAGGGWPFTCTWKLALDTGIACLSRQHQKLQPEAGRTVQHGAMCTMTMHHVSAPPACQGPWPTPLRRHSELALLGISALKYERVGTLARMECPMNGQTFARASEPSLDCGGRRTQSGTKQTLLSALDLDKTPHPSNWVTLKLRHSNIKLLIFESATSIIILLSANNTY
jgi:hypothetical protein